MLQALLQTGSVTHAADMIGRTPPSVSSSLAQLREILKDPLFIRVGNQLQPTARAVQLREPVETAIQQISQIFENKEFKPEESERVFVIVATDSLVVTVGSRIVKELRKRAPNISIQFLGLDENVADGMATREVDFAILPEIALESLAPTPLSYLPLDTVYFDTVLMPAGHALSKRDILTPEDLEDYPQVGFRPNSNLVKYVKNHPMMRVKTSITVSQNLTIPSLIEGTDLIAIVTKSVAERESADRNLVTVPFATQVELPYGLVWSSVLERDEAHVWLRSVISELWAT